MSDPIYARTELLLGPEAMERIRRARVAVFGLGGVGGHLAEALARSGVGALDLIDSDTVSPTNLNRQTFALRSTVGMLKTDAAKARLLDINPALTVRTFPVLYLPETAAQFDFTQYDYVADAIDTVSGKISLVLQAKQAGTPIICAMGAGNKLDPTSFRVEDISRTSVCPLARVMRTELRKRGVEHLKVVYSQEQARRPRETDEPSEKRQIPGSTAFVPSVMGLIMAGEIIKDLAQVH